MGTISTIKVGDNTNFSGSSALAFGPYSTATHNSYHIRFGDGTLTESQVGDVLRGAFALPEIKDKIERHFLIQDIRNLPRAGAAHDDYQSKKKGGLCLQGTRETLLEEAAIWVLDPTKSPIYVLSGLAGIGKSTIAYTFASRTEQLDILGASFFFSRDESDRKSAEKFFTTIAFQLCVHDKTFAQAIGDALVKERGAAAIKKDLNEQLEALILEPLRGIVKSRTQPTVIVIDALDECDDRDAPIVLALLERLVHELPSFKVLLTTRPHPHLDHRLSSHDVFYLQNIENKVINSDIRLYLKFSLSRDKVGECLPDLTEEWMVTDEEIEYLVGAAGKLFIIASTAVRFILDTTAFNPASQFGILKANSRLHSNDVESFYGVIVRRALPEKCSTEMMKRFKTVVGAILFVQEPLPVTALQHLTFPYTVRDIDAVLKNLKSVIAVEHNTPRIFHKSFSDFLTEPCRESFNIVFISEDQNIRLATCCFRTLNGRLKRNILDLKGLARFLDNAAGLERQAISSNGLREKIPLDLDYACRYWATHLEGASITNLDTDHQELTEELSRFANEHLPHWIEVMSWICKLNLASRALRVAQVLLTPKSASKVLRELFSDGLRFISKFYEIIKRSALHIYHSALPFTPTATLLYKTYHKEMMDNICQVEGGPEEWDGTVASLNHGEEVNLVMFSQDSTKLASLSKNYVKFWDAIIGVPMGTIAGKSWAIADGFSIAASIDGSTIAIYDIKSCTLVATLSVAPVKVTTVVKIAISPDGCYLAAGLTDDTVSLWDWKKAKLVAQFEDFAWDKKEGRFLDFNSSGDRLAFGFSRGIKLLNGITGEFVADLMHLEPDWYACAAFSGDGSCIVYSDWHQLSLWDGKTGTLIGAIKFKEQAEAKQIRIKIDKSWITITEPSGRATLWSWASPNGLTVIRTEKHIPIWGSTSTPIFPSDDVVKIKWTAPCNKTTMIYDPNLCFFSHTFSFVLSPDRTRSVGRNINRGPGLLELSDLRLRSSQGQEQQKKAMKRVSRFLQSAKARFSSSKERDNYISHVALSPRSCLAVCRYHDPVELWDTSCAGQLITTLKASAKARFCVFSADGEHLAIALSSGIIKLWHVRNSTYVGTLKLKYSKVTSMVFLPGKIAVRLEHHRKYQSEITLWDLKTLRCIVTITKDTSHVLWSVFRHDAMVAYWKMHKESGDGNVIASKDAVDVIVWDTDNRRPYATVKLGPPSVVRSAESARLSPDKSKLVVQLVNGDLKIFDLDSGNEVMLGTRREDLDWDWLAPVRGWHGIPVWLHYSDGSYRVVGYDGALIPLLQFPRELPVYEVIRGPSIFATQGATDNGILIIRECPTGTFD